MSQASRRVTITRCLGLWREADLICGLSTKGALGDMISMVRQMKEKSSLHDGESSVVYLALVGENGARGDNRWHGGILERASRTF